MAKMWFCGFRASDYFFVISAESTQALPTNSSDIPLITLFPSSKEVLSTLTARVDPTPSIICSEILPK